MYSNRFILAQQVFLVVYVRTYVSILLNSITNAEKGIFSIAYGWPLGIMKEE